MTNTVGDFWRMVWEHKLSTIIMLTKVNEAGKVRGRYLCGTAPLMFKRLVHVVTLYMFHSF